MRRLCAVPRAGLVVAVVGAGFGGIVQCALVAVRKVQCPLLRLLAVEKNPIAVTRLREECRKTTKDRLWEVGVHAPRCGCVCCPT